MRVEGNKVTDKVRYFIRPPRCEFIFTYLHGITWEDVKNEPTFGELWPEIRRKIDGADYLAAHNKGFDRTVMRVCCKNAGVEMPDAPFVCTVQAARKVLNIRPAGLDNVCRCLRIKLKHHNPLSDANACARILLRAMRKGREAFEELLNR